MPIGTPTPVDGDFPDDNLSAVRFFRQQWAPSWEFNATENLLQNQVSPTIWNTHNPGHPFPVDASGNPTAPTADLSTSPIRPYYYDPDAPPIGESGVLYGGERTGHGAWVSFDTMRLDYGAWSAGDGISGHGGFINTTTGKKNPYWAVPGSGFLTGVVYRHQPMEYPASENLPTNAGIKVIVQNDPARSITLPLKQSPVFGPWPTTEAQRMSFYLWTNAYDLVRIDLAQWNNSHGRPDPTAPPWPAISMFWKEARPAHGTTVPLDPEPPA